MRLGRLILSALVASGSLVAFGFSPAQEAPPAQKTRLVDLFRGPMSYKKVERIPIQQNETFGGYTNYWHTIFWTWFRRGNLFQMSLPAPDPAYDQALLDIAEELGVPGLYFYEGFLAGLLEGPYAELQEPSVAALEEALGRTNDNVLVFAKETGEVGKFILQKARYELRPVRPNGHQYRIPDFHDVPALVLESGPRKLLAVVTDCPTCRARTKELIDLTIETLDRHDLHRGWFGTGTLLHSVTCFPGHPLEVIGQGLAQGNDWFTFSGYMDFLMDKDLPRWLAEVGLDVVADVGTAKATRSLGTVAYGCRDWDGLNIQDTPTEKDWIAFVKQRGGYVFRPVYSPECDPYAYDGQIAIEGNKKQIDTEDVPFILNTGFIREDAPPCMVLFAENGTPWTREAMWRAILDRRAVGVLPQGKMLGPDRFRKTLQMLLLDHLFLDRYFGDHVQVEIKPSDQSLAVTVANRGDFPISGTLEIRTGPGLEIKGESRLPMTIVPRHTIAHVVQLKTNAAGLGRVNPILAEYSWKGGRKQAVEIRDIPPAVSVHRLLYGQAPEIDYPVSLYNFTTDPNVPVSLSVFQRDRTGEKVYADARTAVVKPFAFQETAFKLRLPPGSYEVVVSAFGIEARTQLGVEAAAGEARLSEVDLNGDGIKEYVLENGKVKATLLAIGARVIEYVVKERNDNVFFKLWPEKEATDRRPFRERGFYPYGGFEDFLGQASIETHKVYEAEVVKSGGPAAQVRMSANYYGNVLEKTFTLYGDSPLLEVRFALDFRNPELDMLGPQPILELGKRHWTEDVFVVPGREGLEEYRMRPEEYFGRVIFLKEGWNAGYDSEADVSFIGAFPVSEPEFLHMWMNHPSNQESHHYYAEFQPWVPIFQKTKRYFSYYLWAAPGDWKLGLEELRKRNLITGR
jgi:hypothetical protein